MFGRLFYRVALVFVLVVFTGAASARDDALQQRINSTHAAGKFAGLHAVLALHKGEVLTENFFTSKDRRWRSSVKAVEHRADALHDLRSITKSIVSLLYGIALAEGIVPPAEGKLLEQFPEYADLAGDKLRDSIRIKHVLTMQMGTDWNEEISYTDPRNSENAMDDAKDRYRFVLDRPMVEPPGERWVYNGGATAVIAGLITKGSGKSIDDYANEKLFAPLGIERFEWFLGTDGIPSAASGLRLSARDLAKIGQLVVDEGRWQGKQIVPANWLRQSLEPRTNVPYGNMRYGYFWWLGPADGKPYWVRASGNGGQRLIVSPDHDLVIVIYAGNYNVDGYWELPAKIMSDYVFPTLGLE